MIKIFRSNEELLPEMEKFVEIIQDLTDLEDIERLSLFVALAQYNLEYLAKSLKEHHEEEWWHAIGIAKQVERQMPKDNK